MVILKVLFAVIVVAAIAIVYTYNKKKKSISNGESSKGDVDSGRKEDKLRNDLK